MSRRTVYSVSTGSYSSYSVIALFEDRADAEALAATYTGYNEGYVEEFELYSPGDRSRRSGPVWVAHMWVNADGTFGELEVNRHDHHLLDDDGPIADTATIEGALRESDGYRVTARCLTKKQAVKGVKDRAAQVSALILDGIDPREVLHGQVAQARVDRDPKETQRLWFMQVEAENDRKLLQWKRRVETRVALFDGEEQVTDWESFESRMLVVPPLYADDFSWLQPRTESGVNLTTARVVHVSEKLARTKGQPEARFGIVWDVDDAAVA